MDEPRLTPTMISAMDGNSSLKRFADNGQMAVAPYESSFFIPRDTVDAYDNDDDDNERQVNADDANCVRNWKAAQAQEADVRVLLS